MITVQNLTKEISDKRKQLDNDGNGMTKAQRSKIANRITFLTTTLKYLEQDNREAFLSAELSRLQKRVRLIDDDYQHWIPSKYYEKEKDKIADYLKMMGVPKIKSQIRALRFILNK